MIRFSSFDDIHYYVTRGVYDLIPSCKIEWTRTFTTKGAFINTLVGGLGKMEGGPKKF